MTDQDAELEALRETMRQKCRMRLFHHCKDLLGFKDMDENVHGPMCDLLEGIYRGTVKSKTPGSIARYLILAPRGSLKTSIGTVGFPTWIATQNDPPYLAGRSYGWTAPPSFNGKAGYDQRIMVGQETDDNCRRYLDSIKSNLTVNPWMSDLYGNLGPAVRGSSQKWLTKEFNVSWRQDTIAKEANITGTSLETAKNSFHCDVAIWDDIFSSKQTATPQGRNQVINFYREYIPIADKPSVLLLIGTRWKDDDLYGHIMREERDLWTIYEERSERRVEEIAAGKSSVFWPAKYSLEVLMEMKKSMGPTLYSAQMNNDPIDEATQRFPERYFSKVMY